MSINPSEVSKYLAHLVRETYRIRHESFVSKPLGRFTLEVEGEFGKTVHESAKEVCPIELVDLVTSMLNINSYIFIDWAEDASRK